MSNNSPHVMNNMRKQKICFIRHGVARHNLLDPVTNQAPNLEDPSYFDPPLVHEGKQQALQAGEMLKQWWKTTQLGEQIELVITSPLTRCIQTTMIAFHPGDCYASNDGVSKEPKMICMEIVREAYGMHYPDKRRTKSILQKYWPTLELDPEMSEADEAWSPTSRESIKQIQNRISLFLDFVTKFPQSNIVVVTHGVFIEVLLHVHSPEALALDHGKRRVFNCDTFVGDCLSENGVYKGLQDMRLLR